VNSTPAVRDGIVYASTSDSSRFFALDAQTGRLRFNFDTKAYVFSSAALAGGLAYVGSHNGKVYAVDAKTGALAWTFQTEASRKNALAVLEADGSLRREAFAPVFGDFEDMYLDFQRFVSIGGILSSPVVEHGVLYVGSLDGKLYALK
jgi:outer membrane protein assembly factor BamB